jgi:histidinol dehydrogenase
MEEGRVLKKFIMNAGSRKKILAQIDRMNRADLQVTPAVKGIIEDVKKRGDAAVIKYTKKFDGVAVRRLKVPPEAVKRAYRLIDRSVLPSMKAAIANIKKFHALQKKNIKGYIFRNKGYKILQKYLPLESAGIYIPGGQAPLFSTVLMAGIPAKIAGVLHISIVSPPRSRGEVNPYVLVAADMIGIKDIYRAGGAQAVAALAYGTKSIPKVDKVVGPGNIYSTMAKKYLFGTIGIDAINGPSEITIIADDSADAEFIAYDLLAQAEHVNGHSLLITSSAALADKVEKELKNKGKNMKFDLAIVIVRNMKEAVCLANYKAPEHLAVAAKGAAGVIKGIRHAPAIFSGSYTPVAFGDYMAGANHILPTNGTARFFSALSVLDFLKHTHIVECTQAGIRKFGPAAEKMARAEMLFNHAASIGARRKKK